MLEILPTEEVGFYKLRQYFSEKTDRADARCVSRGQVKSIARSFSYQLALDVVPREAKGGEVTAAFPRLCETRRLVRRRCEEEAASYNTPTSALKLNLAVSRLHRPRRRRSRDVGVGRVL